MKVVRVRVTLARLWLALAFGLAPATYSLAQATIAYHQPTEPLFDLPGRQLDLNGDGHLDCQFHSAWVYQAGYWYTVASGTNSARLLVTPQGDFDSESWLIGLSEGYLIGGITNESLSWAPTNAPNYYGYATVLGAYIPETAGGLPVPVGYFPNTTAFMGIQFQSTSGWHYGWVRIRGGLPGEYLTPQGWRFFLAPPAWILDWAYETRPGVPIKAGAQPVPVLLAAPKVKRPGFLRLKWRSEIGKAYQVQAKARLDAFAWSNLSFVLPATSTNSKVDLPMSAPAQFFRVVEAD
jgi:hypothetical protein